MQNYHTETHQQRQETPLSKQPGIGKIHTDLNITSVKEIVGQSSRSVKSQNKPNILRKEDLKELRLDEISSSHGIISSDKINRLAMMSNAQFQH